MSIWLALDRHRSKEVFLMGGLYACFSAEKLIVLIAVCYKVYLVNLAVPRLLLLFSEY